MLRFKVEVSLVGNGVHKTHINGYKTYTALVLGEDPDGAFVQVSETLNKIKMNWVFLYLK